MTENHTIKLLQEMRQEIREQFEQTNTRLDGLTHIVTLLAGHSHDLEERTSALEAALQDRS